MVDTELLDSVLRLKHRRPGLLVRHVPYGNYEFSNELMDAPDIPPRPTAWS